MTIENKIHNIDQTIKKKILTWAPLGFSIINQFDSIIDPEYPMILSELKIIKLERIIITSKLSSRSIVCNLSFFPTYGQCKLAPLIGIAIAIYTLKISSMKKLIKIFNNKWVIKFKIFLPQKNHTVGNSITKQLNDMERLSAALENNSIRLSILKCIKK